MTAPKTARELRKSAALLRDSDREGFEFIPAEALELAKGLGATRVPGTAKVALPRGEEEWGKEVKSSLDRWGSKTV